MSNVLLIINEEAHARELSRVAEFLTGDPTLRPVYFVEERMKPFGVHTLLAQSSVAALTADDFVITRRPSIETHSTRQRLITTLATFARRAADRLPGFLSRPARPLLLMAAAREQMLRRFALCEEVLERQACTAILLCEDNIDLDTGVWISAARRRGIRCIIVPYTIANTVELIEAYVFSKPLQIEASLINRVSAWLFPKWTMRHKGRRFLRATYAKIAAVELLGLTPPNPWLLNSGAADAIAVESVAMRDYYSEAGIPPTQLVTTGTLVDDAMAKVVADAANRRRILLEELGLPPERPVLLCAFPPDQGVFDRPGCDFADFDDLISFWGECLGAVKRWNVIVARHPKTRAGRLDALRKFGVTLTDRDTASLIPLCDLYVASVSATIRWAVACGKPTVNYDAYRLDFQDYPGIEAVLWMNTREDFRKALAALTDDPAYFAQLQAAQRREAPRWGFHDGLSGNRLRALIRGEPFDPPASLDANSGR